jgi:hypothetical protein
MTQLMRHEAPPHAGARGDATELSTHGRLCPRPAARPAIDDAEQHHRIATAKFHGDRDNLRSPRPRSCPWALSAAEEQVILDARASTNRGPMQLAFMTGRHRSTI